MAKKTTQQFLDLHHLGDRRWQLAVGERHTGGRGSLFGGVGLAAAIAALEQDSAAPVVWATAQYISITQQPAVMDLDVRLPAVGRSVTQGQVTGHIGERQVISVMAALGRRTEQERGIWERMPAAPDPGECERVHHHHHETETIHDHTELRMARGMFGFTQTGTPTQDSGSLVWARMTDVHHDAGTLAILADYMPSAVGNAVGKRLRCTSLDNTIRYADAAHAPETEWILLENRIEFIGNGFANGTGLMWSEEGRLLATASQSMIVAAF